MLSHYFVYPSLYRVAWERFVKKGSIVTRIRVGYIFVVCNLNLLFNFCVLYRQFGIMRLNWCIKHANHYFWAYFEAPKIKGSPPMASYHREGRGEFWGNISKTLHWLHRYCLRWIMVVLHPVNIASIQNEYIYVPGDIN